MTSSSKDLTKATATETKVISAPERKSQLPNKLKELTAETLKMLLALGFDREDTVNTARPLPKYLIELFDEVDKKTYEEKFNSKLPPLNILIFAYIHAFQNKQFEQAAKILAAMHELFDVDAKLAIHKIGKDLVTLGFSLRPRKFSDEEDLRYRPIECAALLGADYSLMNFLARYPFKLNTTLLESNVDKPETLTRSGTSLASSFDMSIPHAKHPLYFAYGYGPSGYDEVFDMIGTLSSEMILRSISFILYDVDAFEEDDNFNSEYIDFFLPIVESNHITNLDVKCQYTHASLYLHTATIKKVAPEIEKSIMDCFSRDLIQTISARLVSVTEYEDFLKESRALAYDYTNKMLGLAPVPSAKHFLADDFDCAQGFTRLAATYNELKAKYKSTPGFIFDDEFLNRIYQTIHAKTLGDLPKYILDKLGVEGFDPAISLTELCFASDEEEAEENEQEDEPEQYNLLTFACSLEVLSKPIIQLLLSNKAICNDEIKTGAALKVACSTRNLSAIRILASQLKYPYTTILPMLSSILEPEVKEEVDLLSNQYVTTRTLLVSESKFPRSVSYSAEEIKRDMELCTRLGYLHHHSIDAETKSKNVANAFFQRIKNLEDVLAYEFYRQQTGRVKLTYETQAEWKTAITPFFQKNLIPALSFDQHPLRHHLLGLGKDASKKREDNLKRMILKYPCDGDRSVADLPEAILKWKTITSHFVNYLIPAQPYDHHPLRHHLFGLGKDILEEMQDYLEHYLVMYSWKGSKSRVDFPEALLTKCLEFLYPVTRVRKEFQKLIRQRFKDFKDKKIQPKSLTDAKHSQAKTNQPPVQQQLGWNCFDVAVGAERKDFINFALSKADDAEMRNLLAIEIRNAAVLTAVYLNQKQIEESKRENETIELVSLIVALKDTPEVNFVLQHLSALFKGKNRNLQDLERHCLPKEMHSPKLMSLYDQYAAAHEKMKSVVIECRKMIPAEFNVRSQQDLDHFFGNEQQQITHQAAYQLYQQKRNELFVPAEQAFLSWCSSKAIYEDYINHYYGKQGWVAFQPEAKSESTNTSAVDLYARMLNKQIIICERDQGAFKQIYVTKNAAQESIKVFYNGTNHFEKLDTILEHAGSKRRAEETKSGDEPPEKKARTTASVVTLFGAGSGSSAASQEADEAKLPHAGGKRKAEADAEGEPAAKRAKKSNGS